jgi:hypothetical protein
MKVLTFGSLRQSKEKNRIPTLLKKKPYFCMSFRQKNIYLRTMALYSGKTDKLRPPAPDLVRLPSLRGTKQSRNRLNFAMTAKQSRNRLNLAMTAKQSRNRLNLAMTAKQSVLLIISAPHTTKMGGVIR